MSLLLRRYSSMRKQRFLRMALISRVASQAVYLTVRKQPLMTSVSLTNKQKHLNELIIKRDFILRFPHQTRAEIRLPGEGIILSSKLYTQSSSK